MNNKGMEMKDVIEEMVAREPDKSLELLIESVFDFTISDHVLSEVFLHLITPSSSSVRKEEIRLKRYPRNKKNKSELKIEMIESLNNFRKYNEYVRTSNASQVNWETERNMGYSTPNVVHVDGSVDVGHSSIPFDGYNKSSNSSGMSERRSEIQNIRSRIAEVSKTVARGKPLNIAQIGSLIDNFKLITEIPFYRKKLLAILRSAEFDKSDYGASNFVRMLPTDELYLVQLGTDDKKNKEIVEISKHILESVIREISSESTSIADSYIKGDINYDEYLKEMWEASEYAFQKWKSSHG